MTGIDFQAAYILPAALALLPAKCNTPAARALVLAIGLQESRFIDRRQMGRGPARGFYQFEKGGGVTGVLTHHTSQPLIEPILLLLRYPPTAAACHAALEHNDVLAAVFARLLLFTLPDRLPTATETSSAWQQYLRAWRPGKPHPDTWDAAFHQAWAVVLRHLPDETPHA